MTLPAELLFLKRSLWTERNVVSIFKIIILKIKSETCAYIAYKSAAVISGIPPPETVNSILPKPCRSAICCMPKCRAFGIMPSTKYPYIVQPLVHRSTTEEINRQTIILATTSILTDRLSVIIIVTSAENGVKQNIVHFIFFYRLKASKYRKRCILCRFLPNRRRTPAVWLLREPVTLNLAPSFEGFHKNQ